MTSITELISRQRKNVDFDLRFKQRDLIRLSKILQHNIFENECCSCNMYITNKMKRNKSSYYNFYFNGKKRPLHRLLYINYVENLNNSYVKSLCNHTTGTCLCLNHMRSKEYKNPYHHHTKPSIKKLKEVEVCYDCEFQTPPKELKVEQKHQS